MHAPRSTPFCSAAFAQTCVVNYDLNPALPSSVAPVDAQLAKARRRAVRGIWCGMFCAVRGAHRFQSLAS
jgi:hypothetical protein